MPNTCYWPSKKPFTLTVTPAIWNILETEENIINEAVTSITIPEFSGQQELVKYRIWDGRVDYFSVPKSGASFQDMSNGARICLKGVKFRATVKGRVELGKKVFGKWVQIARMSGDIKATCENADVDVVLAWNDFKFTPTATVNSDFHIEFTHHLRNLDFLRHEIQKRVRHKVNDEVPKKLVEVIEQEVNPKLQNFKEKMIAKGYSDYEIEWNVENNALQISIKPK
ncbi:unnamed protein product [Strongylus vulgaris]|uniref:Lipid-binding serum glycoprotein N-terminal domain-containing protein n=1 Tax=Strongylus vulgaris TaxID=40348 RepID=A0A3P7KBM6_STRVU|nr:unnamed protein product [Strongylus vulgaris]